MCNRVTNFLGNRVAAVIIISRARIYMQQNVLLRLLMIDFVSNVQESPHDEINGSVFILHVFAYFG
jgi:hypothetical protein